MQHQLEALRLMSDRREFALFMEQGTGKTWTLLAHAERLYAAGKINGLLVVAPNGVHTNWTRREIPAHMDVHHIARAWKTGAGKRETASIRQVLRNREAGEQPPLRIYAASFDSLMTKKGLEMAEEFLLSTNAVIVIDESSRIKNPDSGRTKVVMGLRKFAAYAYIASGTPVTNAPADVFAQMEFLSEGLLGTTSYRAFVAEYAELLRPDHPMMQRMIERNPRIAFAQVIAKGADGKPVWRNLDKLKGLLAPHSYRVLKRDCLDLPDKIYKSVYFSLTAKQQKVYDHLKRELRIEHGEQVLVVNKLSSINKLQQITSGFYLPPGGGEPVYVEEKNPRLAALVNALEDVTGQFIVWANFKEELLCVSAALRKAGYSVVEYHGGVKKDDREIAVDSFQTGTADAFVAQPKAGGIGLTLTAAETAFYFSNSYNMEDRAQSEDRSHRKGTTKNVVYIDVVAEGTIDEDITAALQRKTEVAAQILGDDIDIHDMPAIRPNADMISLFERDAQ
jgi:SNF2 family DNA or RNA helicase